jgi:predicted adenylyl cyclase CyaB
LDEIITVKKKREVYIVGQTRIHLDEVDELGTFIELEVVLSPDHDPEEGRTIATELMKKLGINETDLVSGSYADILLARLNKALHKTEIPVCMITTDEA